MLSNNYENFLFYGSFLKTIEAIPDPTLQNKVMLAIIRYGCCGCIPSQEEDPMVYAFMMLVIPNIEQQKKNYEKRGGGRPSVSANQNTFNTLFDEGELTNQEIADLLGVSLSTVDRRKKQWREEKNAIERAESAENITHMNLFFDRAGGE